MIAWLPLKSEPGESRRCKTTGSKAGNSQDNRVAFKDGSVRLTGVRIYASQNVKSVAYDNG
ncbi:MAG: hypothetical protein VB013_09550 [Anaerolineaceae bacterium]|nr:hypothetical protein [Anaerolineaceae bacterium]